MRDYKAIHDMLEQISQQLLQTTTGFEPEPGEIGLGIALSEALRATNRAATLAMSLHRTKGLAC